MSSIEAEYENGVLRPATPLHLRQGERVQIVIKRQPDPTRWDFIRLAKGSGLEDSDLASEGLDDWARALDEENDR